MNDSNTVQFPQTAESSSVAPLRLFQAEYDNGKSYSDAFHAMLGVFTTLELAQDYCMAHNACKYEHRPWDRDWEPFVWSGDWSRFTAVCDGVVRYDEHWTHPEIASDEYGVDHGGYRIFVTYSDPTPPTPEM